MKKLTSSQLKYAGYLSVASAIVDIPLLVLSIVSIFMHDNIILVLTLLSNLVYAAAFIYIYWTLLQLLNEKYKFRTVDSYIKIMIWTTVVLFLASVLGAILPFLGILVGVVSFVGVITISIVSILFGVKIRKLQGDLFGLLKPFSILTIVGGAVSLTILLAPVATIIGIASDIILGMILLRAAKEAK